jgi:hypothetical protein
MRTTLVLDDEILKRARHRAIDLGVTLSELVNRSLERVLDEEEAQKELEPFQMVTFDGGADEVGHTPEDFKRIMEDEDIEYVKRMRG